MIRWAAMLISRFVVGSEDTAAYDRRRGHRCRIPLACVGETAWYIRRDKDKGRGKFDVKWEMAIWLGHDRDSNEAIVGTTDGTFRAYAVKRLSEDERCHRWPIHLLPPQRFQYPHSSCCK